MNDVGHENDGHLYPRFSDGEYQRRYQAVRERMAEQGFDALIVWGQVGIGGTWQRNIHYLSNYADTHYNGYLIFPMEGDPTLFIAIYPHVRQARMMAVVDDVRWMTWEPAQAIVGRIKELGLEGGNIGIVGVTGLYNEPLSVPLNHYRSFRAELPRATFRDATAIVEEVRLIKSAEEIAAMEKAAAYTDMGMASLVDHIRAGASDIELWASIPCGYLQEGGEYQFQLLGSTSMFESSMPYPWKYPARHRIEQGDIVVTEISAGYNWYGGQLIRPVAVGEPPDHYKRLFDVAYSAYKRIQEAVVPGATEKDILEAAAVISDAGMKIHAPTVHGWSIGIHEPFVGIPGSEAWPVKPVTFQEGMTIMIEPNPVAADEESGIFFGSVHVIEQDGARCLQNYPEEFVVVEI
ncbi:MAG: M24 family metallopeptidase [Anaerolineae bacterium]